jgi:DNA-binding winged helix-turn-helix (wHTH) protein
MTGERQRSRRHSDASNARDAPGPPTGSPNSLRIVEMLPRLKKTLGLAGMPEHGRHLVYEFGRWELDLARRELLAHGVPVPLGGRAFQIFAVLAESAGKLVTKDELMARVWPGAVVEENTLEVHISAVRKALGSDRGTLRTSFGRGYRLAGDWRIRNGCTLAGSVSWFSIIANTSSTPRPDWRKRSYVYVRQLPLWRRAARSC